MIVLPPQFTWVFVNVIIAPSMGRGWRDHGEEILSRDWDDDDDDV